MSRAFAREFDLQVICLDEPGVWGQALRAEGIPVHCVWRQPGLDLTMPRKLAALFRAAGHPPRARASVHAVVLFGAVAPASSRCRSCCSRSTVVSIPKWKIASACCVNRALIRRLTHRFVAVSEDVRTRLERYEGLDARADPRDLQRRPAAGNARAGARATRCAPSLGFAPGDFVVGTVGRFDPIKNLPMLVRSLAQASARSSRACAACWSATGPEFARIRALLGELGIGSRVRLTGYRDDARAARPVHGSVRAVELQRRHLDGVARSHGGRCAGGRHGCRRKSRRS